jgi:hypothetical protein
MAIICPNGVMQEDEFHQRTFKVPFLTKKKKSIWAISFIYFGKACLSTLCS